jgi:hypothetical protein
VRFRGISTTTALGLIAEIGDFARFGHPRELCSWLGIVPSEYSSGDQRRWRRAGRPTPPPPATATTTEHSDPPLEPDVHLS